MSARHEFAAGARDLLPALVSLFPIAVIIGITAVETGLTTPQAIWMSVGIYTGLAQAAMLELMNASASMVVIVAAGVIINLRLLLYSASLAPYFDSQSLNERISLAYLNIDTVYALSIATFENGGTDEKAAYYVGAGVASWVVWQSGTLVGLFFGGIVPDGLNLEFAIPLLFIALLVPVLNDRPAIGAGVAGGSVAVFAAGLPFNLGLIVGTLAGILVGVFGERRWST
ncbi:AzlC family ABC transporter permease [Natrinema ejinorense]|uniref:AzlC family ABC transporter permease n=1 Tax=Natrinema ejinorense TaxID=373386 RepID=UPI001476505D|nr:AzlC family ABC transporter permease [Natrinema ejinorense]